MQHLIIKLMFLQQPKPGFVKKMKEKEEQTKLGNRECEMFDKRKRALVAIIIFNSMRKLSKAFPNRAYESTTFIQ